MDLDTVHFCAYWISALFAACNPWAWEQPHRCASLAGRLVHGYSSSRIFGAFWKSNVPARGELA